MSLLTQVINAGGQFITAGALDLHVLPLCTVRYRNETDLLVADRPNVITGRN